MTCKYSNLLKFMTTTKVVDQRHTIIKDEQRS